MEGRECVLVVDDEPVVRTFAVRVLRDAGFEVLEAADGAEALELIETRSGDVRVVVADIVMPGLNGLELLQRISILNSSLPVLLMSGYGATELEQRGLSAPCGLLHKPFAAEKLVEEVNRCLEINT